MNRITAITKRPADQAEAVQEASSKGILLTAIKRPKITEPAIKSMIMAVVLVVS